MGSTTKWDQLRGRRQPVALSHRRYEDLFVKTSEGWRFKKRLFVHSDF
jgi:hypothetical protein